MIFMNTMGCSLRRYNSLDLSFNIGSEIVFLRSRKRRLSSQIVSSHSTMIHTFSDYKIQIALYFMIHSLFFLSF